MADKIDFTGCWITNGGHKARVLGALDGNTWAGFVEFSNGHVSSWAWNSDGCSIRDTAYTLRERQSGKAYFNEGEWEHLGGQQGKAKAA